MASRTFRHSALVVLLAAGLGLATVSTAAVASTGAKHPASAAEKKKKRKKPTVKLATDATLGKILVAVNGRTLYAFDPDGTDTSASKCNCPGAWPPLTAKGKPVAGKGLDKSLLTVGGGKQVAYNGHLLYEFSGDSGPGDTKGQGVAGIWHVVGADGNPIK